MPKQPGRKSTRKTIKLEDATVEQFLPYWEFDRMRVSLWPCCIQGCNRLVGSSNLGPVGFVVHRKRTQVWRTRAGKLVENMPETYGWACDRCTERITEG